MSSHLISESFGPDCQACQGKNASQQKGGWGGGKQMRKKERLNEFCCRNSFPSANYALFLGVMYSITFLPITA